MISNWIFAGPNTSVESQCDSIISVDSSNPEIHSTNSNSANKVEEKETFWHNGLYLNESGKFQVRKLIYQLVIGDQTALLPLINLIFYSHRGVGFKEINSFNHHDLSVFIEGNPYEAKKPYISVSPINQNSKTNDLVFDGTQVYFQDTLKSNDQNITLDFNYLQLLETYIINDVENPELLSRIRTGSYQELNKSHDVVLTFNEVLESTPMITSIKKRIKKFALILHFDSNLDLIGFTLKKSRFGSLRLGWRIKVPLPKPEYTMSLKELKETHGTWLELLHRIVKVSGFFPLKTKSDPIDDNYL